MRRYRWLAAAVVFSLLVAANSAAWGETQVIFTVDVESKEPFSLPQQVDAVCADGSACGLTEIVGMLTERGMAGTFFFNVYEHPMWGKAAMRDIVVKLQAAGQDVALHTHPETVYDPLRTEMYQYGLDEQTAIIRHGIQLLTTWTGKPVVVHRAGDYSADEHTLEALERNGIRVDSSLFWGHPSCRLTGLDLPRNLPASFGRLVEVPVTVYQREERPHLFGGSFAPVTSVRKIDADWFYDEDEARAAIDGIVKADLPFLVIFLHSFSFLARQGDNGVPLADRQTQDIFRAILDHVTQKRLPVITMRALVESEALAVKSPAQEDVLPLVTVRVGLHRYIWHRLRATGISVRVVGAIVLTFLAGGAVLIAAGRWRQAADAVYERPAGRRSATRSGRSPR